MSEKKNQGTLALADNVNAHEVANAIELMIKIFLGSLLMPCENFTVSYRLCERTILFSIKCDRIGAVLGRNGRTISSLRDLVDSIGSAKGFRVIIETVY